VSSNRKTRSEQVVSVFDIFLIILPAAAVFFHLMNYPPDAHQGHIYTMCFADFGLVVLYAALQTASSGPWYWLTGGQYCTARTLLFCFQLSI
jgi:hypothetical protein